MAIDFNTDLGRVRALIGDTDEANLFLPDAEINAILALQPTVLLASADALDVMATKFAITQGKIKLLDLQIDGPAVAKELRERAKLMRDRYDSDFGADQPDFDIAELVYDPFSYRERLLNITLSEGL